MTAPARSTFCSTRGFALDRFQLEAMDALDAGRSVLVTAPTGSGKTVVGEYAVHLALARKARAFYTTPLKALSNQKYGDFARTLGDGKVGLLTGDNSLNPAAPVVVMTTEVLRNMIHADRAGLSKLGYVVLDEVHFLEDPYRGGVWEEVILGAPATTVLVCLSATVANAAELAGWISKVRGDTAIVKEERRPVRLVNLFCIGDRSKGAAGPRTRLLETFVDGAANPAALELDSLMSRGVLPSRLRGRRTAGSEAVYRPRRSEVVETLAEARLLPAIYFVFSRAGCDAAARRCLEDGLRLSSPEDRAEVREIVESFVEPLDDDDLGVLGYGRFLAALEAGIAAHHAGMVPPFREAVEAVFSKGLVKVVFATETLALGINMPARSVVVDELSKFSGAGHADLTPGEYTQLTGRAGRRGIDEMGAGVVVASPFYSFSEVAHLAGAPGRPLVSSFRPTYNLAVSLVRRFDRAEAYRVVTSSFAQYLSSDDLGSELDAVISLLDERGYLDGWRVTPAGEMLAGIYHEADLLVGEALLAGVFDDLGPADLAAVVSAFCYEARRERSIPAGAPAGPIADRIAAAVGLSGALAVSERARGLPLTRGPDAGMALATRSWARGRDLRSVLSPRQDRRHGRGSGGGSGRDGGHARGRGPRRSPDRDGEVRRAMTGGDFVRNVKQVIDLLRQLAFVAPQPSLREAAASAVSRLNRDVVAASSLLVSLDRGEPRAGRARSAAGGPPGKPPGEPPGKPPGEPPGKPPGEPAGPAGASIPDFHPLEP